MLQNVCLGSPHHFGTVLDALPASTVQMLTSEGPQETQTPHAEEFAEYISMRDQVLVEAIVRQAKPPPSVDVMVGITRWRNFMDQVQSGILLEASPTAVAMVRQLMRMTIFETLGLGDLNEITNAFTGPPEDSALAPLKGAHKSSAILKRYMVLASKRLEQLLMDERLQPHAEELTQALDALESSSPDTKAGALAATVSGACVDGAPQRLSTVHTTKRSENCGKASSCCGTSRPPWKA